MDRYALREVDERGYLMENLTSGEKTLVPHTMVLALMQGLRQPENLHENCPHPPRVVVLATSVVEEAVHYAGMLWT